MTKQDKQQLHIYFNQFLVELNQHAIIEIDDKKQTALIDLKIANKIWDDFEKYTTDFVSLTVDNSLETII